tara:strand:+ start:37 stop:594 length:558 start_codon:yes stop_codon:yes gene_type:complete
MKKLLILLFFISFNSFGQKFVATMNGLRDADNVDNNYLVLEMDGLNATELYKQSIKYINDNYNNPEEVIKGSSEGEFLKFDTYVDNLLTYKNSGVKIQITGLYTTELRYKDGRIKYEIISLEMKAKKYSQYLLFSGGMMSGYLVYKKNGKLFKEQTKIDIENYFNNNLETLKKYLIGEADQEDDW